MTLTIKTPLFTLLAALSLTGCIDSDESISDAQMLETGSDTDSHFLMVRTVGVGEVFVHPDLALCDQPLCLYRVADGAALTLDGNFSSSARGWGQSCSGPDKTQACEIVVTHRTQVVADFTDRPRGVPKKPRKTISVLSQ